MKTLIAIGCLIVLLSGCATMSLPTGATAEQARLAKCQDAMVGLAIGQAFLGDPNTMSGGLPATEYWRKWVAGATVAIQMYCPAPEVK